MNAGVFVMGLALFLLAWLSLSLIVCGLYRLFERIFFLKG